MDGKGSKGRGNGGGNNGGAAPPGGGKGAGATAAGGGGAKMGKKGKQKPKAGSVSAATASKKVPGAAAGTKKTVGKMTPTGTAIAAAAAKAVNKANQNTSKAKAVAKKKTRTEATATGANKMGKKQIIVKVKQGPGKKVIITTTSKATGTQGQGAKVTQQIKKKKNTDTAPTAEQGKKIKSTIQVEQKKQSSPKEPQKKKVKIKENHQPPQVHQKQQQEQQQQKTKTSKTPAMTGTKVADAASGTSNATGSPEKTRQSARIATKRASSIDQTTTPSDSSAPAVKKTIISLKKNTLVTDTSSNSIPVATRAISVPEATKEEEKAPTRVTRSQSQGNSATTEPKAQPASSSEQESSPKKIVTKPLNNRGQGQKAAPKVDQTIQEAQSKPVTRSAQISNVVDTKSSDSSASMAPPKIVNASTAHRLKRPREEVEEEEEKKEETVQQESQTPIKKETKTPIKAVPTVSTKDENSYVTPVKQELTTDSLKDEPTDHISKTLDLNSQSLTPPAKESANTSTMNEGEATFPSSSFTTPSKPDTPLRVEALKNAWGPSFGTPVATPSPNKPGTPLSSWFFSNGPANFIQRVSFSSGAVEEPVPEAEGDLVASGGTVSTTDTIKYKQTAFLSKLAKADWRAWYGKVDNLEDILDPPLAHSIEKAFFPKGHVLESSSKQPTQPKQATEEQQLEALSTKQALDLFQKQIQEQKQQSSSMGSFLLSVLQGKTITGKDLTEEYGELMKGTRR